MHLYIYWFAKGKSQLHIADDDATSTIVGAYFDYQETLNGYYNILHQILISYGIPYMFFTDSHLILVVKKYSLVTIALYSFSFVTT